MDVAPPVDKKISGTKWAGVIRGEIQQKIVELTATGVRPPGIACIIVGDRPDSAVYVRNKETAANEVGMKATVLRLDGATSQEDIIKQVHVFNADETIDGILVQLPLPKGIDERIVLGAIDPNKDVDGVGGPVHMGNLALRGCTPLFVPCTAKGCVELLKRENIQIEGANAVVIGRSNIVGVPVALLLQGENATVTVCHSKTQDIGSHLLKADIIVAAIGQPKYVKKEWVKPGAVIIDVGINQIEDKTRKSGTRLVGDVDFDAVVEVCGRITPVPGGVGPMTIAMLLQNTLESRLSKEKKAEKK